jgi:hypothetical protein
MANYKHAEAKIAARQRPDWLERQKAALRAPARLVDMVRRGLSRRTSVIHLSRARATLRDRPGRFLRVYGARCTWKTRVGKLTRLWTPALRCAHDIGHAFLLKLASAPLRLSVKIGL